MSGSDNIGRPRDARNNINIGRAIMKNFALAQSPKSLLLPVHIDIKHLGQNAGN